MHQSIQNSLFLCGVQVTAVALFGLSATWIAGRVRPGMAPVLACWTMIVIATLSLTAPFPTPSWLTLRPAKAELKTPVETALSAEANSQNANSVLTRRQEQRTSQFVPIDRRWLAARFERLSSHRSVVTMTTSRWQPFVFGLVLTLMSMGSLKLLIAWRFLSRVPVPGCSVWDFELK